jgi:hypothetical protein
MDMEHSSIFLQYFVQLYTKGMGASLLFFVSGFLRANMALLSNNPTLDGSFNVLMGCHAISEYDGVMQGQEQEEMGSILWKDTQRPPRV